MNLYSSALTSVAAFWLPPYTWTTAMPHVCLSVKPDMSLSPVFHSPSLKTYRALCCYLICANGGRAAQMRYDLQQGWWQSWEQTHSPTPAPCSTRARNCGHPPCWFCAAWQHPGIWDVFMSTCKAETEGCTQNPTLWWGIIVGVRVALAAVLHQEAGVVPGHVEDAIWLVKEHVGQHSAVAVHDDNLSISSAKQYLKKTQQPSVPPNVSHRVLLQMRLVIN